MFKVPKISIKILICSFSLSLAPIVSLTFGMEGEIDAQNQKLQDMFTGCKTTFKSLVSSIEEDLTELDKVMDANLIVLTRGDEESLIQGLMNYALFINSVKDRPLEVMPWYEPYEARLTELSGHSNPMIRQLTFLVLASTLEKRERYLSSNVGLYAEAEALLGEARVSSYSFIKYLTYLTLENVAKQSDDLDCAVAILEEATIAVPFYSLKLHKRMCWLSTPDLETEKRYFGKRMLSLQKLIEEGTPKQKAKAQLYLADIFSNFSLKELGAYKPEEAVKIYAQVIEAKDSIPQKLYEETLIKYIRFLSYGNNADHQRTALELIQQAMADEALSEQIHKNLEACLEYLYRYGPEGVKNERKALSMLAKSLRGKEVLSIDDLNKLSNAAHLFGYGAEVVRNIKKAIKAYEILKPYESHKESALSNLAYIYRYQAGYQDFPKAIICLRELADHFKDQPSKRYEQLKAVRDVCSIPEALGLGELKAATETLARETEDEEGQLECYLRMANTCNIYPQYVQPYEILWSNQMIVMHPKATDEKVYESNSRIVAAFKAQGDLRQVAPAYNRLLNRPVALGNVMKKRLQADLYQFLNEHRDQAWVGEVELFQLRDIVFPPLRGA